MCIGLKGDTWSRQRLRIPESHPRGTVITTTPPTRLQAKCVLVKTKQKKTVECDGSQRNMLSLPTFHIFPYACLFLDVLWKRQNLKISQIFPRGVPFHWYSEQKTKNPPPCSTTKSCGAVTDHTWDLPEQRARCKGDSRCGQIQNFTQCVESSL